MAEQHSIFGNIFQFLILIYFNLSMIISHIDIFQFIHDDGVSSGQGWHQHLLHIGQECAAVHGPVEDHVRCHALQSERADEGRRLLMPVASFTSPHLEPEIRTRRSLLRFYPVSECSS